MKKLLSVLLALTMCLSLMTFTAVAADGVSKSAQGVTVTIDKSNYQPGEKIYYGWSGVTDAHADGVLLGFVGLWASGADHRDDIIYEYTDYESAEIDYDSSRYFAAPTADGNYEVRFYWGARASADSYVLSVPFTVGNVKTGSISVAQTAHTANTYIAVDYSGITAEMESAQAFVGVFKPGAGHSVHEAADSDYKHVKAGSGQINLHVPNINGQFELRLYNTLYNLTADNLMMSVPITLSGATASEWAVAELERAEELGLIPDCLDGADLTADITRAEFAAVAVKVYEALANGKAIPAVINPFTDTNDVEILKAYNIGAVNGTSATTYSPNDLLNREQAATMLTRVFKKVSIPNWTLATDSQFTLPYEKPALFADDADISDWAKESVYFMVANNIINGVGNNKFAPKNVTSADEANGYANATREQALIIAVRMVENLKK